MDLGTVEENVATLDVSQGFGLIFDLLLAYGMPRASIARLRSGSLNQSELEGEVLWKTKVYYRYVLDTSRVATFSSTVPKSTGLNLTQTSGHRNHAATRRRHQSPSLVPADGEDAAPLVDGSFGLRSVARSYAITAAMARSILRLLWRCSLVM